MTTRELIEELTKCDPDALVFRSDSGDGGVGFYEVTEVSQIVLEREHADEQRVVLS